MGRYKFGISQDVIAKNYFIGFLSENMSENIIRVTVVLNTDIREGAGTEKTALNYIKYAPKEKFEVTLLMTNRLQRQRIELQELNMVGKVRIISFIDYSSKFEFLYTKRKILRLLFLLFVSPLVNIFVYLFVQKNLLYTLGEQDVIYLFSNNLIPYFSRSHSKIIGSDHANALRGDTLYSKILYTLIKIGLAFKRLDGFHFFPYQREASSLFPKKYNITQGIGIDTTKFSLPKEIPREKIKFLFVSRLIECKGVLSLLNAWGLSKKGLNAELHIVGDGPLFNFVQNYNAENVFFHRVLSELALADMYKSADIFIYPTKCDAYPQVILEALSTGLYVVTSKYLSGNFDEFEEMGFLEYASIDSLDLSIKISSFSERIENIRTKRERISKYVAERYDVKTVTKDLYNYFWLISKQNTKT